MPRNFTSLVFIRSASTRCAALYPDDRRGVTKYAAKGGQSAAALMVTRVVSVRRSPRFSSASGQTVLVHALLIALSCGGMAIALNAGVGMAQLPFKSTYAEPTIMWRIRNSNDGRRAYSVIVPHGSKATAGWFSQGIPRSVTIPRHGVTRFPGSRPSL